MGRCMVSIPRLVMDDGRSVDNYELNIVNTCPEHISALKKNLRVEDANEIMRFGISIKHALWYSYKQSIVRKTALINGSVAACWGVSGVFMGNVGRPWLMTTPEVNKVSALKFARVYQQEVYDMLNLFPKLENYVDAEYSSAIRLLDIVGFEIDVGRKISSYGNAYRKFWIEKA